MRQLPICPPYELVEWLLHHHHVQLDAADAHKHWTHVKTHMPWALDAGMTDEAMWSTYPIGLYGDEAQYTDSGESVFACFISLMAAVKQHPCGC